MACTNRTLPILDKPTKNEKAIWTWLSQGCLDFTDPCIIPPILDNPNECELTIISAILAGQCKTRPCLLMPAFTPGCSPNLTALTLFTNDVISPEFSAVADECDPLRTGALTISCLDPNDTGPGATDCSIRCDVVLPEIRFSATGGEPPYTWALSNSPCLGSFRGVGGVGGPTTDSLCDSRFVVTAPDDSGGVPGEPAYEVRVGTVVCQGPPKPATCAAEGGTCSGTRKCCIEQGSGTFITRDCNEDNVIGSCDSGLPVGPFIYVGFSSTDNDACAAELGIAIPPPAGICESLRTNQAPGWQVVDVRTQAQKDAICFPCEMCFNGLIATVTDSLGVQTSVVVTVDP